MEIAPNIHHNQGQFRQVRYLIGLAHVDSLEPLTPGPSATAIQTPMPTATPDLRVIDANPGDLVLQANSLTIV